MSHEVETMFSAKEIPWHGLGTIVPEELGSEEAIKVAGLDWEVTLEPVYAGEDGDILVENAFATVRTRKIKNRWVKDALGVVGDRYTIMQNREMFEFSDAVAATGTARYTTAGSLRKGAVVFSTMLIERPLVVDGEDFIPYLVSANSHDGSLVFSATVTPIRVVCANTLRMALGTGAKYQWNLKHTPGLEDRATEARKALHLSFQYLDGFEAEVQKLMTQKVTDAKFDQIMGELFPEGETDLVNKNRTETIEIVRDILITENSDYRKTGWGLLNSVNSWELWEKPVRVSNHAEDMTTLRAERQAMGILKGTEAPITQKTHRLLVAGRK